jgi:tight adherence protein C
MEPNFFKAALVAIIVFVSYIAFDRYVKVKRRRQIMRTRLGIDGAENPISPDDPIFLSSRDHTIRGKSLLGILKMLGMDDEKYRVKISQKFAQAGMIGPDAPVYYLFFQRVLIIPIVLLAGIFYMMGDSGLGLETNYMIALLLVGSGFMGPKLFLKNTIQNRQQILIRAFPDTLDLLLICVESGMALDAALNRVCSELGRAYPEMTEELNRTRLELALLNDRVRALTNLAERTDLVAFRSLVAALVQSERFGTSLTDTLRVLSEDFRLQRLFAAEAKAAKLPVYMTIPLILLLMPAFFIIILGPAILRMMGDGAFLGAG